MFTVYSDSRSDSTVVSNLFIDEYMKSANDAQIKVYLYLLRMTGAHRTTSISDMADLFNHTEKDVVRSLRYWEQKGLLDLTFEGEDDLVSIRLCRPGANREKPGTAMRILPFSSQAGASLAQGRQLASGGSALQTGSCPSYEACCSGSMDAGYPGGSDACNTCVIDARSSGTNSFRSSGSIGSHSSGGIGSRSSGGIDIRPAGSPADSSRGDRSGSAGKLPSHEKETPAGEKKPADLVALESFCQNPGRQQLLFVIEQYIGKPLSMNEIRIIHHISEDLYFSDDLIDYLLQYCVDRGRKDFRYIQGVAENWAKEGILTPAQAESATAAKNAAAMDAAAAQKKGSGRADTDRQLPAGKKGGSSLRAQKGRAAGYSRTANSFNQFEQNSYDFDALEDELLGLSASGLSGDSAPGSREKQEKTCH